MADVPVVAAEGVWFAYPDADWALRDVSLQIEPGEYVAIVGSNGAGKTTLAKQLNGLLIPGQGQVKVLGQETTDLRPKDLSRAVGYVFQNPDHQIFAASTRQEIAFGPRNLGLPDLDARRRVEDALARFGLGRMADIPPAMLTFPLRRKVALASVYAMRPQVLILDEPTGGLDRDSVTEVMEAVADLHADGHAIVLISHDMRLVARQAERVILLQEGRVALDAVPREVFAQGEGLEGREPQPPQITRLARRLAPWSEAPLALTVEQFAREQVALLSVGTRSRSGSSVC